MLTVILSMILFLIFSFLSGIHIYWFFGGNWGVKQAIPTKSMNSKLPTIPKLATLIVALGLLFFAMSYLEKSDIFDLPFPESLMNFTHWFIPAIFILRAIGEFNYVGLFRKIKSTDFAMADKRFFTPLCIFIGGIGILIQLMH